MILMSERLKAVGDQRRWERVLVLERWRWTVVLLPWLEDFFLKLARKLETRPFEETRENLRKMSDGTNFLVWFFWLSFQRASSSELLAVRIPTEGALLFPAFSELGSKKVRSENRLFERIFTPMKGLLR